jgi:hypothetical protein
LASGHSAKAQGKVPHGGIGPMYDCHLCLKQGQRPTTMVAYICEWKEEQVIDRGKESALALAVGQSGHKGGKTCPS